MGWGPFQHEVLRRGFLCSERRSPLLLFLPATRDGSGSGKKKRSRGASFAAKRGPRARFGACSSAGEHLLLLGQHGLVASSYSVGDTETVSSFRGVTASPQAGNFGKPSFGLSRQDTAGGGLTCMDNTGRHVRLEREEFNCTSIEGIPNSCNLFHLTALRNVQQHGIALGENRTLDKVLPEQRRLGRDRIPGSLNSPRPPWRGSRPHPQPQNNSKPHRRA